MRLIISTHGQRRRLAGLPLQLTLIAGSPTDSLIGVLRVSNNPARTNAPFMRRSKPQRMRLPVQQVGLMQVEITDGDILVDAVLLGELLDIEPAEVSKLMRAHAITGHCERGVDAHQGQYRLSFFYQNRRVRLSVDSSGHVLGRSIIEFGQQPLPRALHRSGE